MTYDYYDPDEAEQRFDSDMEQLERIAELEADRDHWRELFCEQAGDTLTLDRENAELKSLVQDMLFAIRLRSISDLTDRSVLASWFNDFSGRASELGLSEGDAE